MIWRLERKDGGGPWFIEEKFFGKERERLCLRQREKD